MPYKSIYIDLSNKPKELLELNPAGSVPVVRANGKVRAYGKSLSLCSGRVWAELELPFLLLQVITESEGVLDMLEHDVADPKIAASAEAKAVAPELLKSFAGLIKNAVCYMRNRSGARGITDGSGSLPFLFAAPGRQQGGRAEGEFESAAGATGGSLK